MVSIEVDFDVFKELTVRRKTEATTYSDVMRDLLRLPAASPTAGKPAPYGAQGWLSKGVFFPNGTELRATYKGRTYSAKIENNQMLLEGQPMKSPSAAAGLITGTPVNGWRFWECKLPHETRWRRIDNHRS